MAMAQQDPVPEELPVRERIIFATMVCLERDGMDALTVRAIAREAGVNVAAVNYYFGSKDRLLQEVQRRQLVTGFSDPVGELDGLLAQTDLPRAEALRLFLAGFISDMVRYPRTVEAHLHEALTRQDYSSPTFRALNTFLADFHARTREMLPDGDDAAQHLAVAQLWSTILFLGLLPDAMLSFTGRSLVDADDIDEYAAGLVARFFPRA
jgi:AcrR family transcriptional regulator